MNDAMRDLLSFDGRIGRQTYWLRSIGVSIVYIVGALIAQQGSVLALLIGMVPIVAALWASLATSVKRSHDRGKSGYFILVSLIPLIGGIWLFIELGCKAGTPGPNMYGPAPGMMAPAY